MEIPRNKWIWTSADRRQGWRAYAKELKTWATRGRQATKEKMMDLWCPTTESQLSTWMRSTQGSSRTMPNDRLKRNRSRTRRLHDERRGPNFSCDLG
ncbi:hypothetical protein COOONC_11354 [Cooperia oncophora]